MKHKQKSASYFEFACPHFSDHRTQEAKPNQNDHGRSVPSFGHPSGAGTESYCYTASVSGPASYTNQLGKVTQYTYHAAGWKTNEVYVGMATNSFTYDPLGSRKSLKDGKLQLTSWAYDEYGRVTNKVDANSTTILHYNYDANSRLTNRWSVAIGNTKYAYDTFGNLTNIDYGSSTDIRYQYDVLNRLTNMVDAAGTTTWSYDSANRYTV